MSFIKYDTCGDSDIDNLGRIYEDGEIERDILNEIQVWVTERGEEPFAFLLFDLDKSADLRSVSIQLKISVMEELLSLFKRTAAPQSTIFGHGTRDDIALLLPLSKTISRMDILQMADEMRAATESHTFLSESKHPWKLTVSGGVSVYPIDGRYPQELYLLAEGACRLAKNEGRNCCRLSLPGMIYILETSLDPRRFDMLMQRSLATGKPIATLIWEAIQLVLQRHSGLERFSKRILPPT